MGELSIHGTPASYTAAPAAQTEPARTASAARAPQYDRFTAARDEAPKSILEAMREAREQAEETAKKFKIKSNVRYGDFPMEAYARLGRARTKADASAAAGYARRCLCRLRSALRQDEDQAGAIRCAMRQLEKVALRANRKKRDIDREHLLQLRRRRAAEEERKREASRLHTELQRRRAVRAIRESGYLHEAAIEQGMQAYRDAMDADRAAQLQAVTGGGASAAGAGPDVAGAEFSLQA